MVAKGTLLAGSGHSLAAFYLGVVYQDVSHSVSEYAAHRREVAFNQAEPIMQLADELWRKVMEGFLGQILLLPYRFEPKGWMSCDGRCLPISGNQFLYSFLGISFGGNGVSNFALPDLRDKAPDPYCWYFICVDGIIPDRT